MDAFSYLSVLLSIILGLAVTQILTGFRGLFLARGRIRLYWPTLVWAVLLLLIFVQSWWAMFGLREHLDWSFIQFAVVLLQPIVLYLLAGLVLPDFGEAADVDLREHYYRQRRWFFGFALALAVVSVCKDFVVNGQWPERGNLIFHFAFMAMSGVVLATAREWIHKTLALVAFLAIGAYIALLFARLH